jgi:hypothetical protein
MRQKFFTTGASWVVSTFAEENVPSCREGNRIHSIVEFVSLASGVNANSAEIRSKGRLHLAAYSGVQRLAPTARVFNRRFNFRRHLSPAVPFSSQRQHALYVPISISSLQLEDRAPSSQVSAARQPVQGLSMRSGTGCGPRSSSHADKLLGYSLCCPVVQSFLPGTGFRL